MRQIDYIVVHCTATQPKVRVENIEKYWYETLRWKSPGYHYIVNHLGYTRQLQPNNKTTNGVKGYNLNSIHVSYIGGIGLNGYPKDTRTDAQKVELLRVLKELRQRYPDAIIQGHRDFPKVKKACPSFDAKAEYAGI